MQIRDNLVTETGWEIREPHLDPEQIITNGSTFMTGNGYLGYRGTAAEWGREHYVACTVTDTWDNADGKWTELCTVPNALYLSAAADGREIGNLDEFASCSRELDFRYGIQGRTLVPWRGAPVTLDDERFASYDDLHLVAARAVFRASGPVEITIRSGIDSDVWSLNGDHFASIVPSASGGDLYVSCTTGERALPIAVAHSFSAQGGELVAEEDPEFRGGSIFVTRRFRLKAAAALTIVTGMAVYSGNDTDDPVGEARRTLNRFRERGYDDSLDDHRLHWDRTWAASEIVIEGDELAQTLLRYNMYQNFIATPAHTDHLPIGARGLSCQAYQGAAFWDQEIFNLPVYLYTQPEVARGILTYRHRTIDGARRKAASLGYRGAFYAWISADTGDEICPSYFFRDVLTGRPIHNHFNDWQIHVSPDIAYTVWKYYQATGDFAFLAERGAEIVFEVMRFLESRAFFRPWKDRYEFIRLLGPDEYHENVDNNFFTAYQARYVARLALQLMEVLERNAPAELQRVRNAIELEEEEVARWREMARKIFVPEADAQTGVIEQFDGFFNLEDITPDALATRLKDPGEYWGWPNGIAVETQVSKQADVVQLFALHPRAYDRDVMRANYRYYEPRTQHGSSLSYSVYAMVAAWTGDLDEALRYFVRSSSVDLLNTGKAISGGTFIGGIHTAACGAAWQIVVAGFGGAVVDVDGLSFQPRLPRGWSRLVFPFVHRGNRLTVTTVRRDNGGLAVTVAADESNGESATLRVYDDELTVKPGASVETSSG